MAKVEKTSGSSFSINSLMNVTTLHVILEVVTICGMWLYFNNKFSKQQKIITELSQKVAEYEENIQRHEEILEKVVERLNAFTIPQQQRTQQPVVTTSKPPKLQPKQKPTKPSQSSEQVVSPEDPLSMGLLAGIFSDIMTVSSGSLSTPPSKKQQEIPLPSIEELDSELESELQDLKDKEED